MADVAGGEKAGHAGFQIERIALERPALRKAPIATQIGPRQKIAFVVSRDADLGSPIGMWRAAEAQKEPMRVYGLLLPGFVIGERDGAQDSLAMQGSNFRVRQDFDVRRRANAVHEVLGKSFAQ